MKKHGFIIPELMPYSNESPKERFARSVPLQGTPGHVYVQNRGVSVEAACAANVRFDENYNHRAAVLVPMQDKEDRLRTLHGRYLHTARGQSKMLSIGTGDGVINVLGGWRAEPFILVEGLFDALSLASCGYPAVAVVGCRSHWLPEVAAGRIVWLGFDACKPGEADVALYRRLLTASDVRRLSPPPGCKDWNTALAKRGRTLLSLWLRKHIPIPVGDM